MSKTFSCLLGLVASVTLAAQNPRYALIGNGCPGSMPVSRLVLVSPPAIGSTLLVEVTNLPVNLAFMVTGLSNSASVLGSLPLSLSAFGMPGCVVYASPDTTVLLLGSVNRGSYSLPLPVDPGLAGVRFFQQALVIDWLASNAASAVVSDAAEAVIGGPIGLPVGTPVANMIPIASGAFLMGSNPAPGAPYYTLASEHPIHQVTISRSFWMGRFEVTQAEYRAVMNVNPSYWQASGDQRPVESVTWNDAMAYCAALTTREASAGRLPAGYHYRLPTEAEWEYCCRAGTTTEFHYGSSLLCGQANINYSMHQNSGCIGGGTAVVGSFLPNVWGLYDMHGNVAEWCLDAWDGSANYPSTAVTDPYVTSGALRVQRGGTWGISSDFSRSAARNYFNPASWPYYVGFRVVLAP